VPVSIHSIARDTTGIIYIGTNNSLLRFNGELRSIVPIQGQVLVTCNEDGRVFAAGLNSFGIVEPDENRILRYNPVNPALPGSAGQARQLISSGMLVVVRFDQGTYIFSEKGLQQVNTGDSILSLVKTHDGQLLAFGTKGIFLLKQEKLFAIPVPHNFSVGNPELIVKQDSSTIFRFAGGKWLDFRKGSLSIIAEGSLNHRWNTIKNVYRTGENEFLGEDVAGSPVLFNRNLLPLGEVTIPGGPGISGKFQILPVSDEEVILVDQAGLWKPMRMQGVQAYFLADYGIYSDVTAISRAGNMLYIIADDCVFSSRLIATNAAPEIQTPFRKLQGPFGKVLALKSSGKGIGSLYIASSNGIWVMRGEMLYPITQNRNFREVVFMPGTDGLIALEGGNLLRIKLKNPSDENKISPPEETIISGNMEGMQSACISGSGEFFLRTADESLFRLSASGRLVPVRYPSSADQAAWIRFAYTSGGGVLLSSSGAYLSLEGSERFISFAEEKNFTIEKGSFIYPLAEEPYSGKLLMGVRYLKERLNRILLVQPEGASQQYTLPGSDDFEITALQADSSGFSWIASQNTLYCLDTQHEQRVSGRERTILTSLILGRDSLVPEGWLVQGNTLRLTSRENKFSIKLANTGFEDPGKTLYKIFLEGETGDYSPWSTKNEYTFSGLAPGKYILRVISRTGNSVETPPFIYHFVIARPFYQSWYSLIFYLLAIMSGFILYLRWRSWRFMQEKIHIEDLISKRTEELTKERDKSEQLIANILPKDTADELKKKGKASSQKYELVTVLFSDIQGFTHIAEQMNPETLIDQLDTFYYQFDSVAEKYNIEKIKTIGDAYMCAGGIPDKNRTNPVEVVLAGLEMQQFMKDLKATNANIWDLRIGVHTGPVIAGVVGHKKFSYDIWGDTVNVASRMESSGEAGKVNISGHTYDLVREFFICEYRGKMPVKYKGEVDMYFVKGIRPELSMDLKGLPNRHFFIQLQNLRLMDLEEFILENIGKNTDGKLHFHNLKYTMDVYTQCELLGRAEGLSGEELLLLRTAGLLQGMGYVLDYADPATRSAAYAAEILPSFKYDQSQTEIVSRILGSAKNEPDQLGQLEKIFSDACLNYLGRPDYPELSVELLLEINEHGKQHSAEDWIHRQEKFLQQHQFFTTAARRLREYDMSTQLQALKVRLSAGTRQS
jgi:class 3 adenylate cyclase